MRKQPFKTKFTPYFKLDWGKKYPKAEYPHREKEEVHTFDIKAFVKEQKKKKLIEMMNSAGAEGGAMPPNGMMPGMPAGMPAGMPNGMPSFFPPNFMPNQPSSQMSGKAPLPEMNAPTQMMPGMTGQVPKANPNDSFNVDDLVRKIDAKIAALEQEEKQNKESVEKKQKQSSVEVIGDKDSELFHKAMDVPKKENSKSLIIEDEEEDDDFFDDFFDS